MLGKEEYLQLSGSGQKIPQLAFGLYKVPPDENGEKIILDAIDVGYRHFDTASFYGNEQTLGRALKKRITDTTSKLKREDFFICSKVWNDAQKGGRDAVIKSVETSLELLDIEYIDLFLIHWPVPGLYVQTYKVLEELHQRGKIRGIGLSNFNPDEYLELLDSSITMLPEVNQFEVSPVMYRATDVDFFQNAGIVISSSKALHRGASFHIQSIQNIAKKHGMTPAQVFLRWGMQKEIVVVAKTSQKERMIENRASIQNNFTLDAEDMIILDGLTTKEDVTARRKLEVERKASM